MREITLVNSDRTVTSQTTASLAKPSAVGYSATAVHLVEMHAMPVQTSWRRARDRKPSLARDIIAS